MGCSSSAEKSVHRSTEDSMLQSNNLEYQTRAEDLVYKSCSREWIVILEKLPDTETNESRSNVKGSRYAKFRADKLKVVDIVHKFDSAKKISEIQNSVYANKKITYIKGEIITIANFSEKLDIICAPGIHYFKSFESAYFYELEKVDNGLFKTWHDNGQPEIECTFKDGKLDGRYKEWYENGQLSMVRTYKDGNYDGPCKKWYSNGQLLVEYACKNEIMDGSYKKWNSNGQLEEECTFKDGKVDGLCKQWYEDGQPKREHTYKDGKEDGLCKEWYKNGQLYVEYTHKDGKEDGLYKEWFSNGQLKKECTYKEGIKYSLYTSLRSCTMTKNYALINSQ
jgi:antitoxin component YwqK of YwqJK toxin-antitoxin module